MDNVFKILGAAAIALVSAFIYFHKKGQKDFFEQKKVGTLDYDLILEDVKTYLEGLRAPSNSGFSLQLLANDAVINLKSFLRDNNINFSVNEKNNIALILQKDSRPIYICVYTYSKLATDLKDIFATSNIFSQEID